MRKQALGRWWRPLKKFHQIHPTLAVGARAGIGATAGYAMSPEDRKMQGLQTGALIGAGSGLLSKGVRQGIGSGLKRQWYGLTGHIPGYVPRAQRGRLARLFRRGPSRFKALEGIQSAKYHKGSMFASKRQAKQQVRAGRAALRRKYDKGLLSPPDMYRAIKKRGPGQFAKDWWSETGWRGLAWPAAFTGIGMAGQMGNVSSPDPEKRRQARGAIGDSIGSGIGWTATGMLPMSVWMPASAGLGYLGRRVAGG